MPLTMPTDYPVHVLVTRPEAQSAEFAAAVAARFGEAAQVVVSPLMEIVFLENSVGFDAFDAVVFTSQNGVAAYRELNGPSGKVAYCVGERTAKAAKEAGLKAVFAEGEVGSLNEMLVREAPSLRLLHLSGKHVSGEIEGDVTRVIAYEQRPLSLSEVAKALLARPIDVIVPFFSANAVRWFEDALPEVVEARLFAVCMSKLVAEQLNRPNYANLRDEGPVSAKGMMDKMSDFFPVGPA